MKQSEYAQKLKFAGMVSETYCMLLMISVAMTLQDKSVMKRNIYSQRRIIQFINGVYENYNMVVDAFNYRSPEREYCQDLLMRYIKQVMPGIEDTTFQEAFPHAKEIKEFIPRKINMNVFRENMKDELEK